MTSRTAGITPSGLAMLLLLSACDSGSVKNQQGTAPTPNANALEQEAQALAQRFSGQLQPALQAALTSGGPVGAIEVCGETAPAIARALSAESGWIVRRVSLQPRNRLAATADAWETAALIRFDERQQAGESGSDIRTSALVDGEFRYLQAQPAAPLCLTCHGSAITEDVRAALQRRYPEDLATGYSAGQIRGAISLRKVLE